MEQLSAAMREEVRREYLSGRFTQKQLATQYSTNQHEIRRILKGIIKPKPSLEQRFWSKVHKGSEAECWEWQASVDRYGYGRFWMEGRMVKAHRVAYWFEKRRAGKRLVRHKCDNPTCCNPSHLLAGNQANNVRDMIRRRRYRFSIDPATKLEICFLRDLGYRPNVIARYLNVNGGSVVRITRGDRLKYREDAIKTSYAT